MTRLQDMASERLTRSAYEGLYEAVNLRRLVAFVGSGVSLVYGSLTWKRFRNEVIDKTEVAVKKTRDEAGRRRRLELQRALDALEALRTSDMQNAAMVFDLCERAFNLIQQIEDRQTSGFGRMLQKIFISDQHFASKTLKERIDPLSLVLKGAKDTRQIRPDELGIEDFYRGLSAFYSVGTLEDIAERSKNTGLQDLLATLKAADVEGVRCKDALPIDRRSLLNIFLAFASLGGRDGAAAIRATVDKYVKLFGTATETQAAGERRDPEGLARPRPLLDPLHALSWHLNVNRYLTTNYDLELENLFMFHDRRVQTRLPVDCDKLNEVPGFSSSDEGRSWARRLANGRLVRSDVYDGVSTSRLFEFAIGSVENAIHIFHMHGRADRPNTMIATDSDYNRQYRREGLSRPSLDRAYDVAISGNPILFVGSGMTEAELNRTLRHRVSNERSGQDSPVFVLRPAEGSATELLIEQLTLFTQLGVHVIHYGHPRRGRSWSLRAALVRVDRLAAALGLTEEAAEEKRPPWQPRIPKSEGENLQEPCELFRQLELDREILAWLNGAGKAAWNRMHKRCEAACPERLEGARALLSDYLDKLVEKLNTASLIHEIAEIGREAGAFYQRKSRRVEPREVRAFPTLPKDGTGAVNREFGVRHVPAVSDPKADDRRWSTRPPDGTPQPIRDLGELLPNGALAAAPTSGFRANIVIGDRGTGKGTLLEILARDLAGRKDTLILNCSFGLESDSILLLVESFIMGGQAVSLGRPEEQHASRRQKMRAGLAALPEGRNPLLVLGAVDRLFGLHGRPLTDEFEWLLRLLLDGPKMHILMIGSRRCERYFRDLLDELALKSKRHRIIPIELPPGDEDEDAKLLRLIRAIGSGRETEQGDDGKALASLRMIRWERQASFVAASALDDPDAPGPCLTEPNQERGRLGEVAQEIFKALAFVGLPCEAGVLKLAPGVSRALKNVAGKDSGEQDEVFIETLDRALDRRLLKIVEASGASRAEPWPKDARSRARHVQDTSPRFVLHRLLFQEIRSRYGLPFGETLMHSSYSLSLYASQPDDAAAPALDVAADLIELADAFITGWMSGQSKAGKAGDRPDTGVPEALQELAKVRRDYTEKSFPNDPRNPDRLAVLDEFERRIGLTAPLARESLRAAGGVIRSLLSAANLLGLDVDSARVVRGDRAAVSDQKVRIRKLLDTAIELQEARESFTSQTRKAKAKALRTIWLDALESRVGAPEEAKADDLFDDEQIPDSIKLLQKPETDRGRRPFYEEEIVWLLNERAVLSLAQGDLYAAATTFELALRANRPLEGDCYHPNRCRLLVNRALLSIERGRITEARRSLADLQEGLRRGEGDAVSPRSDEGRLILALCRGYEGLCDDLHGMTERADRSFRAAIRELYALRQPRAIAIFQLHRGAMLQQQPEMKEETARCLTRALAAAEAGRHTDIAYRIRVAKAELDRRRGLIEPATALSIHQAAIRYAEQFEMYRNAAQALGASALLRLDIGDVEAAAVDCSRALALACRYGMTLNRIALRILTGRVLHKRGDIPNARFMFERAVSAAERIGYQRAVDLASEQIMRLT